MRSTAPTLSKASRLLILCNTLFTAGLALSSIFINVYIWKVDRSFVDIGLFNLFVYVALPIGFLVAGWVAVKLFDLWLIRIGLVALSGFFITMLVLRETSAHYVIWLGMMFGFGQGLYWYGFHVTMFSLTQSENRAVFNGANGFFASLVGMLAPFVAGFLITHSKSYLGYHLTFGLSLALFFVVFWLIFTIPHRAIHGRLRLSEGFRLGEDPDWRMLWLGSLVFGLREGVFAFFVGLLVYFATRSEEGLGEYGLWTGLVSLLAFYLAGQWVRKQRWEHVGMIVAGAVLGAVGTLFWWGVNRTIMIVFGTVTALSMPFFVVPFSAMLMNEIDESPRSAKRMPEYLISREIALGIGRVSSILAYLLIVGVVKRPGLLVHLTVLLGFAHMVVAMLIKRVRVKRRMADNPGKRKTLRIDDEARLGEQSVKRARRRLT